MTIVGYIGMWEALLILAVLALFGGIALCVLLLVLRKGRTPQQSPPAMQPVPTTVPPIPSGGGKEPVEFRLNRLSDLRQKQLISEEDFQAKRQQILGEL